METRMKRDNPLPSRDKSPSSFCSTADQRSENDYTKDKRCKNDNRGRDWFDRKENFDNKFERNFINTRMPINGGGCSSLSNRDKQREAFVEQNISSAHSCAMSGQLIAETQYTPHSSSVGRNAIPYIDMHTQANVSERLYLSEPNVPESFSQCDGMKKQDGMLRPALDVMHFRNCILYPPSPFHHLPSPQLKPIDCKMIMVRNLPEKITEEIIREIFEYCGNIIAVKMNKFFCYVCFTSEDSVDKALTYSGYVISIPDEEGAYHTKAMYVDYAVNIDSQSLEDFEKHKFSSVGPYSKEEANDVIAELKKELKFYDANSGDVKVNDESSFYKALHVLNGWLANGECVKSKADEFYNMIMTVQRLSERIHYGKGKYVDKKNEAEHKLAEQVKNIFQQFNSLSKFFHSVRVQKVWDQFSKAQRKNIEKWQAELEEIKNASNNELLQQRIEDDMDISDDEKEDPSDQNRPAEELEQLREEGELFSVHLELLKKEKESLHQKNNAFARQSETLKSELLSMQTVASKLHDKTVTVTSKQINYISLISTFLSAHHFGASIDYICSYLQQFDTTVKARDIESLMKSFPTVFNEKQTGIGATLETKWNFCDLNPKK